MKVWMLLGLLAAGPSTALAADWADLWHRADQQGEAALKSGNPQRAAALYTDPRRQAFAQLQAGHFGTAADKLAPFNDPLSEYNRGNALARDGKLASAIEAYEAVLKHAGVDPDLRHDTEHNRNLVAQQLRDQKKSSPEGHSAEQSSQGKSGKPKSSDGTPNAGEKAPAESGGQQGASGAQKSVRPNDQSDGASKGHDQPSSAKSKQNTTQAESSGSATPSSSNATGAQDSQGSPRARDSRAVEDQHGENMNSAVPGEAARTIAQGSAKPPDPPATSRPPVNPGHPNNDARLSTPAPAHSDASEADSTGSNTLGSPSIEAAARDRTVQNSVAPTERQLAQEQWLRQIPDDPGGLLRRKFLIEHLMKQQQVQP